MTDHGPAGGEQARIIDALRQRAISLDGDSRERNVRREYTTSALLNKAADLLAAAGAVEGETRKVKPSETPHDCCINCLEAHDGRWFADGFVGPFCGQCAELLREGLGQGWVSKITKADTRELSVHGSGAVEGSPASPWQPIETGPEATWVLVMVPNYGMNIATMTHDPNISGPNGDFWFIRGDDERCVPTHWMPLPDPPLGDGGRDHPDLNS